LSAAVAVVEDDDGEASMFVSKYFSWSRGAVVATAALLLLLCSSRLPLRGGTLGGGTLAGFKAALAITGGGEKTTAAAFGEWSLALEPADGLKSLADWGNCFPGAEFDSGFWKRRKELHHNRKKEVGQVYGTEPDTRVHLFPRR
jgi:hypothetical protein